MLMKYQESISANVSYCTALWFSCTLNFDKVRVKERLCLSTEFNVLVVVYLNTLLVVQH
jgi:hypothetical protein